MQRDSEPQETNTTAGRSLHTGQQVCRAQHSRSRHRLRLAPRVSPRGQCSGPSSPPSREASRLSARLAGPRHPETSPEPSGWGSLRSPGAARGPPPQTSSPGALGLTPFSPTSKTGYLVHALQTTLWTFSLLFKSPPGERGKKKSRGDPSQLERKKKKFKGIHSGEKGDLFNSLFLLEQLSQKASSPPSLPPPTPSRN